MKKERYITSPPFKSSVCAHLRNKSFLKIKMSYNIKKMKIHFNYLKKLLFVVSAVALSFQTHGSENISPQFSMDTHLEIFKFVEDPGTIFSYRRLSVQFNEYFSNPKNLRKTGVLKRIQVKFLNRGQNLLMNPDQLNDALANFLIAAEYGSLDAMQEIGNLHANSETAGKLPLTYPPIPILYQKLLYACLDKHDYLIKGVTCLGHTIEDHQIFKEVERCLREKRISCQKICSILEPVDLSVYPIFRKILQYCQQSLDQGIGEVSRNHPLYNHYFYSSYDEEVIRELKELISAKKATQYQRFAYARHLLKSPDDIDIHQGVHLIEETLLETCNNEVIFDLLSDNVITNCFAKIQKSVFKALLYTDDYHLLCQIGFCRKLKKMRGKDNLHYYLLHKALTSYVVARSNGCINYHAILTDIVDLYKKDKLTFILGGLETSRNEEQIKRLEEFKKDILKTESSIHLNFFDSSDSETSSSDFNWDAESCSDNSESMSSSGSSDT